MENSRNMVIGIIIVVALLVIGSIWLMNRGEEVPELPAAVGDSTNLPTGSSDNSIDAADQFPGDIVYIPNVSLRDGGFVVIEKGDGKVVGSQYFSPTTKVGSIAVTPATKDGESYVAKLYADTNADGKFDTTVDQPINGATGQPVQASFNVLENLPEKKG